MKILIFGSSGFLGKSVFMLLRNNGYECYTVSRNKPDSNFIMNISELSTFNTLPKDYFDVVINCASVLPGGDYLDANHLDSIYKTNILGTQNICNWIASQTSIKKIINCSTLVVVGKPWSIDMAENASTHPVGNHVLYCSSKLTQEIIFSTFANKTQLNLVQLRFSALYGNTMSWSGIICNLIDQARNDKQITISNGSKVSADFLHVGDASKIIMATLTNDLTGAINAASGVETTVLKLAEIIQSNFQGLPPIINNEDLNFIENRANINVDKLKIIIAPENFIEINLGISKMINL